MRRGGTATAVVPAGVCGGHAAPVTGPRNYTCLTSCAWRARPGCATERAFRAAAAGRTGDGAVGQTRDMCSAVADTQVHKPTYTSGSVPGARGNVSREGVGGVAIRASVIGVAHPTESGAQRGGGRGVLRQHVDVALQAGWRGRRARAALLLCSNGKGGEPGAGDDGPAGGCWKRCAGSPGSIAHQAQQAYRRETGSRSECHVYPMVWGRRLGGGESDPRGSCAPPPAERHAGGGGAMFCVRYAALLWGCSNRMALVRRDEGWRWMRRTVLGCR